MDMEKILKMLDEAFERAEKEREEKERKEKENEQSRFLHIFT